MRFYLYNMSKIVEKKNKAKGMVLILTIIIIGTVLSSATVFANLIIREIQQSRLIDQSIQALYLAESGAEKALYQSRRRQAIKPADCSNVILGSSCQTTTGFCSLSGDEVPCITTNQGNLPLRGSWSVNVTNEMETSVYLGVGESFQVDLFSPYQTGEFQTQIQSFLLDSDIVNGTTVYGEITNLSQLVGGTVDCPLNYFVPPLPAISKGRITLIKPAPESNYSSSGYLTTFTEDPAPELNPNCAYILRVSNILLPQAQSGQFTLSIYQTADNVDPATDKLPILSRFLIDSEATFGKSYQKVRVRAPMRPPLSGLYDFVIFSEEALVK